MIKRISIILLCCALFLLCGCNRKYKRISFESETLGEEMANINEKTAVINKSNESFSAQMPIYTVKEKNISYFECKKMMDNLGIPSDPYWFEHDGNEISINLARFLDTSRGYFNMTEEELEKIAWETFNKIPFIEGEYEYFGRRGENTITDSEGEHITRVLVSFYRILDGARVIGDDRCDLWFDGSGLVELRISLYDFRKTGTMDMVPLEDATARIKTPDDFSIEDDTEVKGVAASLQVDRVKLLLINQHSRGCTILQPVYNFIGTATFENGHQAEFKSKVIAIPETMTYVEE